MAIIDGFVGELEHEAKTTQRFLERVPASMLDWRPHSKSMSMGTLASHIADIPNWVLAIVHAEEYNDLSNAPKFSGKSAGELVAHFDKNVAEALAAMRGFPDDKMFVPWTYKFDGHVVLTMPRVAVLRGFVMNHVIHHRAQLGVYFRLNDIPVPSSLGPSADES
jgi:uncharacterized damage-inducible protein DinB